jgi:hypothetical protein
LTVKDAVEHLLAQTGLGFTTSMGTIQISALSVRHQALRAQASIPLDTINVEGGGAQCQQAHPYGYGPGCGDRTSNPQQVVAASKTGTKLADIPGSVQTVPHELLYEQGATMLRQSLDNASGVNFGGSGFEGLLRPLPDPWAERPDLRGRLFRRRSARRRLPLAERRRSYRGCRRTWFGAVRQRSTGRHNQYRSLQAFFRSSLWRERAGGILRHGRQQRLHYRLDEVTWIELPD